MRNQQALRIAQFQTKSLQSCFVLFYCERESLLQVVGFPSRLIAQSVLWGTASPVQHASSAPSLEEVGDSRETESCVCPGTGLCLLPRPPSPASCIFGGEIHGTETTAAHFLFFSPPRTLCCDQGGLSGTT